MLSGRKRLPVLITLQDFQFYMIPPVMYTFQELFGGKIDFENGLSSLQCMEGLSDVFIAKFSNSGQFKWALKVGLDTYPQENYLTYLAKCSKDGVNKGTAFLQRK